MWANKNWVLLCLLGQRGDVRTAKARSLFHRATGIHFGHHGAIAWSRAVPGRWRSGIDPPRIGRQLRTPAWSSRTAAFGWRAASLKLAAKGQASLAARAAW